MSRASDPRRQGKVATLQAVAALAGCSTATVSKALNGLPVSAANLERVRHAADQLGYVPNNAGRNIRGARTRTIGIVMNMDVHPRLELLALVDSTIVDMEAAGYSVMLSVRSAEADVDVVLRRFLEHRVDGLFYWNARPARSLEWYRRADVPVLAVAFRDEECADLPLITADGSAAYRAALGNLRALGHTAIGEMVSGGEWRDHRAIATAEGLGWHRMEVGYELDSVVEHVRAILGRPGAPTAILAAYPTALQVLAACEQLGRRVPDDLSLVTITDAEGAALLRTPLSAIRTDFERLGHAAAQAMIDGLGGAELHDVVLTDGITWIDRGSTGPRPG